ncbi:hypothetical protein CLV78_105204 [Aliiruegeria haliotis]|uniref:Uncharacterized protein n=1 Tax=Aliiruegeria haliotis TaxID=1280846 RepID=A0A2T0RPW9_9RHOB|nr:hypothetical protein [Aliiruegeria haliotis]PRY23150.1 hypothetical protein CLV78_105204 [Aliiruegeria haliotis]
MGTVALRTEPASGLSVVVAAGRDAWRRFCKAQELGLDQLFDVGRALMEGRRLAMAEAGTNKPMGAGYARAFQAWCEVQGFVDVPTDWRGSLMWCCEHETEVRAMWAEHAAIKKSRPSLDPRNMANMTQRRRRNGPPKKRRPPTVAALPIATLCASLGKRLAALDPASALAEISELATALEAAALQAQAGQKMPLSNSHPAESLAERPSK